MSSWSNGVTKLSARRLRRFQLVSVGKAEMLTSEARRAQRAEKLPKGACFYSHSIVPGGLLVMSSATRLTPGTSLMIRLLTRWRRS
jgi:hypothetical protein